MINNPELRDPLSLIQNRLSNINLASLTRTSKKMKGLCNTTMSNRYSRKYSRPVQTIQKEISKKMSHPKTVQVNATNTTFGEQIQKTVRINDLLILHKIINNNEQYIYGRVKKIIKLNKRINFEFYPEFLVSDDFNPTFYFKLVRNKEKMKTNRFTSSKYNILHV